MLLLASQSFPHYGLERFFEFAKKAEFDGVEITVNQNYDTQDPVYLKKLSEEYNMPIRAFSLPLKNPDKYLKSFQDVVKHFPDTYLNLESPELFSYKYKHWVKNILPKLCKKYDLHFNRQNSEFKLLLGIIPTRVENSLYALKEAGHVSLDLSALWSSKEDVMRAIKFLGNRLRHVYLSNVHNGKGYAPLQKGMLPVESFLSKLAKNKYQYDFTLKIAPNQLKEGDEEAMMEILEDSLKVYKKYFKISE